MTDYKIISRKATPTFDNPDHNAITFDFVKDGVNHGGRTYDLTFWKEADAKTHFIKWCGY